MLIVSTFTFKVLAQQSHLSKTVNHISEYIASEDFLQLKKSIGDLSASDSIFVKAVQYNDNNIGDALLGLMLATVPYREVPIQLPIVNSIIYYPLTSADEETFFIKNKK